MPHCRNLRVSMIEVILHLSDVTAEERRRGQQRQELLIAELNHRIRNILGLIRGVISQSKDPSHTVEIVHDFRRWADPGARARP